MGSESTPGAEEQNLRDILQGLLAAQGLAALATKGEDGPYCCLVAFAVSRDLCDLLFVTHRSTRKYRNILLDPRVCLLVDSRSNSESDFQQAVAVTVVGSAANVDPAAIPELLSRFFEKHPALAEFASSPDRALMRVQVDRYIVVRRLQLVCEFRPLPKAADLGGQIDGA